MLFRDPVVLLDGPACARLARLLRQYARPDRAGGTDRDTLADVEEICAVGHAHQTSIAGRGNAALPTLPDLDGFADDEVDEISTTQAADRIGCRPRNVRYLADRGRLAGRKIGPVWVLTVESVERYRTARAGH